MDSARRWSGFVCPDCRFVFRVPRDHDGQGIVCPSCRRMLKIPAPGDRTPPLVVSLRTTIKAEATPDPQKVGKRKKKRSRNQDAHAWDSESGKHRRISGSRERRQTLWMLAGGTALLVLVVSGVMLALHGRPDEPVANSPDNGSAAKPLAPAGARTAPMPPEPQRTDEEILALAEPMARKFLEATRVEDLLPMIRNPKVSEPRIRKFYAEGKIDAPGLSAFNTDLLPVRQGQILSVKVRTRDFSEKTLSFVETASGIKIDWESWVGWSETTWEEFLASKSATPRLFRLVLSPVEYFNFAFTDDLKWQSYYLTSADGEHAVYGYAERGSDLNSKLRPPPEVRQVQMTLAIRFPEKPTSANQVIIDKLVTAGWVIENDETP